MNCNHCGKELSGDVKKDARLDSTDTLVWCGNLFHIEDKRQIVIDDANPLCSECWSKFLRWYVGP